MTVRLNERLLGFLRLLGNVEVVPHQLLHLLLRAFANVLLALVNFRQSLFLHLRLLLAQRRRLT